MNFKITAPGKVILHGEHSVVYGKSALAGVVGMRTQLELTVNSELKAAVFNLKNLDCTFEIQLSEINEFLHNFVKQNKIDGTIFNNTDSLLAEVRDIVSNKLSHSNDIQKNNTNKQANAFIAIYYLLCGCFINCQTVEKNKISSGFKISLHSNMEMGAGLGSSASYGVSLVAAFLLLSKQIKIETYNNEESLSLISRWAYESERVMHGNPSGLDNTVCTYGGIVCFAKGKDFSHIKLEKPFSILVVNTKVERSTKEMVANVNKLMQAFPKVINCIWSAMEEIVNEVKTIYKEIGNNRTAMDFNTFKNIERLYQINNDLLKAIGVSHPELEKVFSIANRYGFCSKITGAGGGGYVIIPLHEVYNNSKKLDLLIQALNEAGFETQQTIVGGPGVEIIEISK